MNKVLRIRHLFCAILLGPFAAVMTQTQAADFPGRELRLSVGQPPGGPTDLATRVFAEKLSAELGKPVVVENRPGANGLLALNGVARATPDGHTIQMAASGILAMPALSKAFGLDYAKDLAPVSIVFSGALVFMSKPSAPYKTIDELVEYMKNNPGKVNYANISSGDLMPMLLFKAVTRTDFVTVRYNGGAPVFRALMAGEADIGMTTVGAARPLAKDGKVQLLAVTTPARTEQAPDVPSLSESRNPAMRTLLDTPGFSSFWFGLVAPGGTPDAIVKRLHEATVKAMRDPDLKQKAAGLALELTPSTPEAFRRLLIDSPPVWTRVAKDAGIQAE